MTPLQAGDFIKSNLALAAHPDDSRIKFHQANTRSGLWRFADETGGAPPYWAFHWAGGGALLRHMAEHPALVRGRSVVDFGAGSGVVGIAALRAGAHAVRFIEPDPVARAAIGLNCGANGVSAARIAASADGDCLDGIDLLLAGDVFYSPAVAECALDLFGKAEERGIAVLTGDPLRRDLPRDLFMEIARYQVRDFGAAAPVEGCVLEPLGTPVKL